MSLRINWDAMGISASLACAIHCAVLPLLLTSLPLFGVNIINNELFEWIMIGLAFIIGTYALVHGYKTHHRSYVPIILFYLGFAFLVLKQFYHSQQLWFLIPAVVLIVLAHYYNYRLCSQCREKQSCTDHQH